MNYYIYFVKNSFPGILQFKTKAKAEKWLAKFYKNSNGMTQGDWIELYFKGSIFHVDEGLNSVMR